MKILVVDDSGAMRKLIITTLSNYLKDTEFEEASDGSQAIFKIKAKEYNLILMDWNMPNLTGIEAVHVIRSSGIKTPIIMVTTNSEKQNVIQALKEGANNYLIKPFSPEILISKVQKVLNQDSINRNF